MSTASISIHRVRGAVNKPDAYGNRTVMPLLRPASIEINRSDRTPGELLQAGELDAIIGTALPDGMRTDTMISRALPIQSLFVPVESYDL